MRILTTLTYYYPHWTGLTAYARRIAEGLAARGHKMLVVTSQNRPDLPLEDHHNGVDIKRLPAALRLSRGQVMPQYPSVMRRLVREFDVVQTHTPMLETWLVGTLAHRAGRKMLMTHHGDLVMPAGPWNRFVQLSVGAMLNRGAAVADAIAIHSQDYADHSAYLAPYLDKVRAIYPPVVMPTPDGEAVAARRRELGLDGARLVGFAGRFVEEKGFDFLLKAIPLVLEKKPDVKFAYAGDHNVAYEGFYERWQSLIDAHRDHIVMMGLITYQQELANYYAMCDVFALPSRTDCFPSVQIEAMLSGTPVVATDIPGAREVASVTGMGLVVDARSEKALADGLLQVLADPESYSRPRDYITHVFDTETTIAAYESLLLELVN